MAVDMTKRRVDREEFLNKETVGFMDAAHRKGRLSTPPSRRLMGKGLPGGVHHGGWWTPLFHVFGCR